MSAEQPKRLAPTLPTVRHLFAHSGNQCAFDPCDHPLIDQWGNFVGEICHIRAALPEGERFEAAMTNEQRRAAENLLLMCHRHHVETDNLTRFDVAAMIAIKARHEAKFAAVPQTLSDRQVEQAVEYFVDSAIADRTLETPYRIPSTCDGLDKLRWQVGQPYASETARDIADYVKRLRRVPVDARAVLSTAVDRGAATGGLDGPMVCLLADVALATGVPRKEVAELVAVLDEWGVAYLDLESDDRGLPAIVVRNLNWNLWNDIKEFAAVTGHSVREFAVELRFDLLDELAGAGASQRQR